MPWDTDRTSGAKASIARHEANAAQLRERLKLDPPPRKLPKRARVALHGDALSTDARRRSRYIDNVIRTRSGLDPIADETKVKPAQPDVRIGRTNPRSGYACFR